MNSCSHFTMVSLALGFALFPHKASAHPTQFTTLQVMIDSKGQFQATLNIDILSFALGQTSLATSNEELEALLDGPRSALRQDLADEGERFRREVVVHTDVGEVTPSSWGLPGLPEVDAVLARNIQPRILVPGEITFSGRLPVGARTVSIRLPYVLGDTVHVYELPNGDTHDEPVAAGAYSSAILLNLSAVGFNVGLECGQLAILIAAFLIVGWFRWRPWYRPVIVIPASTFIALLATAWTLQRIFIA